ncbi:hypothetical protein [Pseudoalteromonas marina]|uniref:Uncharacterized protein n=1 Tax=Pseudoalteromonas marina TaxID=267375 RepID=A0ABT9FG67_9GAMM|nr:hypothetical protein [Pseudoalteromonas marina]MDP2565780.1 hypothetical protein [Pseudoalteromonas marina]
MKSTPFDNRRETNEEDEFSDYLETNCISFKEFPSNVLSEALTSNIGTISHFMIITAAKERLRWLSRKLYSLIDDDTEINKERALLDCGELTDDQLANHFFMTEEMVDLKAGAQRINWLFKKIIAIDKEGDVKPD